MDGPIRIVVFVRIEDIPVELILDRERDEAFLHDELEAVDGSRTLLDFRPFADLMRSAA